MNVLITGGAGSIGAALTERLSLHSDIETITVYDNLSSGNTDFFFHTRVDKNKVRFVESDILETRKIQKLVKGADAVIHLASLDINAENNAAAHLMEQVNHWGTAELSYAIENASVKKTIFLSTTDVYGFAEEEKNESSEANPVTAFAHSKLRGEAHVIRLKSKLNSIVFRSGVVAGFGPVKRVKGVANQFAWDAITKNRLSIHGNGKQIRPFVDLNYVTTALEKALTGEIGSGIYNLVQANLQVLDLLEELKKIRPELEFIFSNHHLQFPSIAVTTEHAETLSVPSFDLGKIYNGILQTASLG